MISFLILKSQRSHLWILILAHDLDHPFQEGLGNILMIYVYDFRWKWINHAKIIKLFLYNEETNFGFNTANANIEEFRQTKTLSPASRRYQGKRYFG